MNTLVLDKRPEERSSFKRGQLDKLRYASLELKGQYAVMREIASTYHDVSKKYIMPGVNEVDRLSVHVGGDGLSPAQIRFHSAQISRYADEAQKKIYELAGRRQSALRKQLEQRRGEVEELGYMIKQAGEELRQESVELEGPIFADEDR